MNSRYIKRNYYQINSYSFETIIAKLYVVSLPFRMISQLSVIKSIFGVCANFTPFVFHILGLIIWLFNEGGKLSFDEKSELVGNAAKLLIWLNTSSIIMAVIMQLTYGNHGYENAFQGIAGMMVYFTQYFMMFLYNYRVFKLLSIDELNTLLHIDCLMLLVIGYAQVLVMNGFGIAFYNRLNVLGFLNPPSRLPKLCLTGAEGATAGCILGVFVFPFLFSQILIGKRKYIFEIVLWLLPLFFTYSATAYILAATNITIYILLQVLNTENLSKGAVTLLLVVSTIGFILLLLAMTGVLNGSNIEKIRYLLLEKANDTDNQSTVQRTVPLYMNLGAFKEYPILGVGNGLQGYFYEKYMPSWMLRAGGEYQRVFLKRSRMGIANGALFIPSLLSGYGVVGCILIVVFIINCIKENKRIRSYINNFYFCYIISGICFIIMGFQGDAYGMYLFWFFLSIPFMCKKVEAWC